MDDWLLHTLLRIEHRVVAINGLPLHVTAQPCVIERTRPEQLLGGSTSHHHMQRGDTRGMCGPGRQESRRPRHQFVLVHRAGLLAQLPVVQRAGHCRPQRLWRVEELPVAALPGAHFLYEPLLLWLAGDALLHERQHWLGTACFPVLFVGGRDARFLRSPVPGAKQEHHHIRITHSSQADLLRGLR